MKFTIANKEIMREIKKFSSMTLNFFNPTEESVHLYFEVKKDEINLYSKNEIVDLFVNLKINNFIKIESEGFFNIKARALYEILNKNKNENITLEIKDESILLIYSDDFKYELTILKEIKTIPHFSPKSEKIIELEKNKLQEAINKIGFSCSEKQSRIILQGVNFSFVNNKLNLIASDAIRVSTSEMITDNFFDLKVTIHIKVLREIFKIFEERNKLRFIFEDNNFYVFSENTILKASLLEGSYPNLIKAFPEEFLNTLKISSSLLNKLLSQITILSSYKTIENMMIKLTYKEEKLSFETKEVEVGSAFVTTKEFLWNGKENFSISFRPKYLQDVLKIIEEKNIVLYFNETESPFLVKGENNNLEKYLILPLMSS